MNDRELLELAAKAAGYAGMVFTRFALMEDRTGYPEALYSDEVGYWNPLTDDGDGDLVHGLAHG